MAGVAMFSGVLRRHLRPRIRRLPRHRPGTDATATHAVVITPPSATSESPSATPRPTPAPRQVTAPLPASRPRAVPPPGPRILGPGDHGPEVRDLQARLRQIAWYFGDVSDRWDKQTTAALKGFQEKREIAVTGYVDRRTLARLHAMTRTPTADELANRLPGDLHTDATARRPVPDGSGTVHRQVEQHHPVGRGRQGAADDGGALRCVVHPDPRGPVPRRLEVARPRLEAL